jgi:hypothetical protein
MFPRADILDTSGSNITTLFPHNTASMIGFWRSASPPGGRT